MEFYDNIAVRSETWLIIKDANTLKCSTKEFNLF